MPIAIWTQKNLKKSLIIAIDISYLPFMISLPILDLNNKQSRILQLLYCAHICQFIGAFDILV